MNSGQTFMVIAAMILLGTLSLGVNRTLMNSSSTSLEMEAGLDALSYGQSLMDEILDNDFDQKTMDDVRAFSYSDITPIASLGLDAGEAFSMPDMCESDNFKSKMMFNDVDDFNNYTRIARNSRLDNFTLIVKVEYVQEDSPNSLASSPTFYKRITITISNPYLTKDVKADGVPLVLQDLSVYRRYF